MSKGFQIMPGLAYQWNYTPDLKHWTFYLQPGARWSDGVEVRAQDFVLGWRTLCDPKTYSKEFFDLPKALQKVPLRICPSFMQWIFLKAEYRWSSWAPM